MITVILVFLFAISFIIFVILYIKISHKYQNIQHENEDLKSANEYIQKENEYMIFAIQEDNRNIKSTIENIQNENDDLRSANEDLQEENNNMQSANEDLQKEIDELKSANENLKKETEDLKSANENLKKETEDLKSANKDLQKEIDELKSEKGNLQKETEDLKSANENLQKETEDLKSANEDLQKEIDELKGTIPPPTPPRNHEDYYGIHLNYRIDTFKAFELVYSYKYSHYTTLSELTTIRDNNLGKLVCVGARYKDAEELSLVACGDIEQVFTQTSGDTTAHLHEGVWWYMWDRYSFGFSFVKEIYLRTADTKATTYNNMRLSWHLVGHDGGWRAGEIESLNKDNDWYKIIYVY